MCKVNQTETLNGFLCTKIHLTKFVQLHPVTSKRAREMACQLLDIFNVFGAPSISQSDNGKELVLCCY